MNKLTTINFHGDTLFTVESDGAIYVAIKPICEALGIAPQKQIERLRRDAILSEGTTIMVVPSAGGLQETALLRLELVNGFLFTIDDSRVTPEAREKVLNYKRECHRVLFEHFYGRAQQRAGHAVGRRRKTPTLAQIARGMKDSSILIRQLKAEVDPAIRKFIYSGLVQTLDVINVEAPTQAELLAAPDGQELAKQLQGVFRTVPDEDED